MFQGQNFSTLYPNVCSSACSQSDPECQEFFPCFTRTSHCSVAGMLVRRVVTINYWRRGGGGEHGGGGEEGGGGGGGAPPHIPAVMGSDVLVTSSPLLA